MQHPSPPLLLLTSSQLFYSLGSFIADYNETHVLNPRWPPHARFHNGQTMSLAVMLACVSLFYAWRDTANRSTSAFTGSGRKDQLFTAAIVGSLYPAAGLTAIWYPGTEWIDPEFREEGGPVRPQMYAFSVILGVVWVSWFWEGRRVDRRVKREEKAG